MKTTVSKNQFVQAFDDYGRGNNFSRAGREALYDYLDDDENYELDVIAICCEFSEYENLAEFQKNYGIEYETIDDIENKTMVIKIDDESFIIQQF
jgi:hypothetical protein